MATPTTKTNRTVTSGKDQLLMAGIQKDLSSTKSIPLGGMTYTPATLTTFIQSRIDAANEVVTAKAAWQSAGKAYEALNARANVVVHDLKQFVIGVFGADSHKLPDFGFTLRKKVVLTPEQKVLAVKKRAATRVARGTKGPKARLAIHGTVTPTGPATPAAQAAPAASPGPNQGTLAVTSSAQAPVQAAQPAATPAVQPIAQPPVPQGPPAAAAVALAQAPAVPVR